LSHYITTGINRTSPDYEYIVYLRPKSGGKLATALQLYSNESKQIIENEAHQYLPHCTLTGFFKIPQTMDLKLLTSILHQSLADLENRLGSIISITNIFCNSGYIGLSFDEETMNKELRPRIENFATKMKQYDSNVRVKPEENSHYHISLAYGKTFGPTIQRQLLSLIDAVNIRSAFKDVEWKVETYCRISKDQTAEDWMTFSIEELLAQL